MERRWRCLLNLYYLFNRFFLLSYFRWLNLTACTRLCVEVYRWIFYHLFITLVFDYYWRRRRCYYEYQARNGMICVYRTLNRTTAAEVQMKATALVAVAARAAALHGIQIITKQKYTYTSHARIRYRSYFLFVYFSVSRICSDATAIYRANTTSILSMVRFIPWTSLNAPNSFIYSTQIV